MNCTCPHRSVCLFFGLFVSNVEETFSSPRLFISGDYDFMTHDLKYCVIPATELICFDLLVRVYTHLTRAVSLFKLRGAGCRTHARCMSKSFTVLQVEAMGQVNSAESGTPDANGAFAFSAGCQLTNASRGISKDLDTIIPFTPQVLASVCTFLRPKYACPTCTDQCQ